ncbi:alpha/beta hydrolase, partial [Mycobacterium sp. ITM-2017-0098]
FNTANSPDWQRFWHERRLQGMPASVLARTFSAMYGPGTPGRRAVAFDYLTRRRCPVLAVYAETAAANCAWERTLPHGPQDRIVL